MPDMSFLKDKKNYPVMIKDSNYIKSVSRILFSKSPSDDEYDQSLGLGISERVQQPYTIKRDSDYEQQIATQFSTYTDLILTSIVVNREKHNMYISYSVSLNGNIYDVLVEFNEGQLDILINQ